MNTTKTHKTPSETAFSYAVDLTVKLGEVKGIAQSTTNAALISLGGMSADEISKWIDVTQQLIAQTPKPKFVPVTLAYVPPAGQYLVNGEHLTLKKSKSHGGILVYKGNGYWGALATAKLSAVAEALNSAEKAQAACIAYAKQTGKCGVCNTKLTDPKSIAAGIGPICAKKYA